LYLIENKSKSEEFQKVKESISRLILKLVEQDYEKLAVLVELYNKYLKKLGKFEEKMEYIKEQMIADGNEEGLEELEDSDFVYLQVP
jgi:hypothetical protein